MVIVVIRSAHLIDRRPAGFRGQRIDLPGVRAIGAAAGWAGLDILAAALALYCLIPAGMQPGFLPFLPVFCLALAAGLFSSTPGGAGPFELTLLGFCAAGAPAEMDAAALVTAVLGFRLIYFAVPAVIAIVVLVSPRRAQPIWRDPPVPRLTDAPRAETRLLHQINGSVQHLGASHAAVWETGHCHVAMFDPFGPPNAGFLRQLEQRAKERNRFAMIYKSGRKTALEARKQGWAVLHLADEAVLPLSGFSLHVPSRAGLRRKLRKAAKSGVTFRKALATDLPQLEEVDRNWQIGHGSARGGTMGRFCPDYLSRQLVFVAEQDGWIVAFASFHNSPLEWTLDLLRHQARLPDGTMHGLVACAIEHAQHAEIAELCLAAVPACPDPSHPWWSAVTHHLSQLFGGDGLRQFKSTFAPEWRPVYASAPSSVSLAIGLLDIAREVFFPRPVVQPRNDLVRESHNKDEYYEVASDLAA